MIFHPWPNPDLISIGPFAIRFYGIVYALGYVLVSYMLAKADIKNLSKQKAYDLVTYGLIAGLVGARLFYVLIEWQAFADSPLHILAIWQGGLAFQGGLAGTLLFAYWYCKRHNVSLLEVTDAVAVWIPLVLAFGRIANFINAEHLGRLSDAAWCVVFPQENPSFANVAEAVCRHPSQLYQSLSQFMLFGVMWLTRRYTKTTGVLTSVFLMGYGAFRFFTDFFRADYAGDLFGFMELFGISHTQFLNLVMLIIGVYLFWRVKK